VATPSSSPQAANVTVIATATAADSNPTIITVPNP
jgi:hypothetical protein